MNIKQITERQFNNTMLREGQEIAEYYSGTKYKVFFRKTNRGTDSQGKLRLYYAQDTNITMGTIFTYKGENYIISNQDATESNIYYTSIALKCNTTLPVQYNNVWYNVPIVVSSDKYGVSEGKIVSVISGSIIVYTGLNDISKNIAINKIFKNFGGTYKVGNYFYNNNMAYLYLTRELNTPDTYAMIYNGVTALDLDNKTYQLSYAATINDVADITATITYASSDTTIATVNSSGLLTMLKTGSVTITATWVEHNTITSSTVLTIMQATPPVMNYTMTILSSGTLLAGGFKRTFTPKLVDSNGVEQNFTAVWTFNYNGMPTGDFIITYDGNKCMISVAEDYDIIDNTLVLTCTSDDGLYSVSYNAVISA